jgi:hypothetical protein
MDQRVIRPGLRRSRQLRAAGDAAALLGMLAYTWVASALEPFTWPARITIGVLGIGVLALAARAHRRRVTLRHWWLTWRAALRHDGAHRTGRSPLAWRTATLVWGGLILAVAIWELTALFSGPRLAHPTLSSITDLVLRYHAARFLAYLLWMALGVDLLRR